MSWLSFVVLAACVPGGTPGVVAVGETADAVGDDTLAVSSGQDPSRVYFCGNGFCDPGERVATCPEDCDAGEEIELTPELRLQGESVQANEPCASWSRGGWHYGGLAAAGGLPYSAFGSDCGLGPIEEGQPTFYEGFLAQWTFTVDRPGTFDIKAWIPSAEDACADATPICATAHYYLRGPSKWSQFRYGSPAESLGGFLDLWVSVALPYAGDYTLYLPDGVASGCACGPVEACEDISAACRVVADHVYVERL